MVPDRTPWRQTAELKLVRGPQPLGEWVTPCSFQRAADRGQPVLGGPSILQGNRGLDRQYVDAESRIACDGPDSFCRHQLSGSR